MTLFLLLHELSKQLSVTLFLPPQDCKTLSKERERVERQRKEIKRKFALGVGIFLSLARISYSEVICQIDLQIKE